MRLLNIALILISSMLVYVNSKITFVKEEGVILATPKTFDTFINYYENVMYLYCGYV
jgi:hypothetical protein